MQSTSINLLTRDGGISATFTPALLPDQYAALHEAIKHDGETIPDMTALLRKLARSWGCEVSVDPC